MAREMTPQERADLKEIARKLVLQINEITPMQWDKHDDKDQAIVLAALQTTRRAALLEIRQFCVDYEDCCVLSLVAHANKAVTDASISTMQFIKRHIDDRLAQEG